MSTHTTKRYSDTILIDTSPNETRVCILDKDRKLIHIDEQSKESTQMLKNTTCSATISSISPQINAVFVDFDSRGGQKQKVKHGFLAFNNIHPSYYLKPWNEENGEPDIHQLLKVGQKLLVQVKKDQHGHESKGAALTTYISLAGTYIVLLPNSNKQAVSRKADANQKAKAKELIEALNIPEEHGIILRTAGIDKDIEELKHDYAMLIKQWEDIKVRWEKAPVPSVLHEEENVVIRNLRDRLYTETQKIITNSTHTHDFLKEHLAITRPSILEKNVLELYTHSQPLFEHYGVEDQIEEMFQTLFQLPSGGELLIQGTEAGVMIDVNSSKSTVGANIEETALNTNLEAAAKAADLLRLRDMGGIIYIDFIDMKQPENREKVEQAFLQATSCDKAKIKHEPISELSGCMLILRQSMGYPFFKSSLEPIPNDPSIVIGKQRSAPSYAGHVFYLVQRAAQNNTDIIQIQVPVDVATYMLNEGRERLTTLEKNCDVKILVIPNETYKERRCTIKRFKFDDNSHKVVSYKELPSGDTDKPWRANTKEHNSHEQLQSQRQHKSRQGANEDNGGFLDSIWGALFGNNGDNKVNDASGEKNHNKHPSHRRSNRRGAQGRHRSNDSSRSGPRRRDSQRNNNNSAHSSNQAQEQPEATAKEQETHKQPESSIISSSEIGVSAPQNRNHRRGRRNNRKSHLQHNNENFSSDSDLIKHLDEN